MKIVHGDRSSAYSSPKRDKTIVTIAIEPCLVKLPTIICFTHQLTVQRHMTYFYLTVLILIQKGC